MDNAPRSLDDVRERISAHPVTGTPAEQRDAFERLAGAQPTLRPAEPGPPGALETGEGPTLVWFHGGGFVFGSPESHGAMAGAIAAEGVRVVLPRIRLAPEAIWPAMLSDALAALDALAEPVAVGGVSAGGISPSRSLSCGPVRCLPSRCSPRTRTAPAPTRCVRRCPASTR